MLRATLAIIGLLLSLTGKLSAQKDTLSADSAFEPTPDTVYVRNIYDFDNSKRYAEYLSIKGRYALAADEYERLVFMRPENDTLKWKLFTQYRYAKLYSDGIRRAQDLYAVDQQLPRPAALEYTRLLALDRRNTLALEFLDFDTAIADEEKLFFRMGLFLSDQNFDTAVNLYRSNAPRTADAARFEPIVRRIETFRPKSAWLAGSMSAIIPGTGKYYTGDWEDGLLSTVSIGLFAWQTISAFDQRGIESGYAWVMGSLGAAFYLGNIYGSARSAIRYNERFKHNAANNARLIMFGDFR